MRSALAAELEQVRRELDALCEVRTLVGFTVGQAVEYGRLCELEGRLLWALQAVEAVAS